MEHTITQFGIFFALSAIAAIAFLYVKQSTVLAYILVGIIIGFFRYAVQLDQDTMDKVSEIGIILLLFLAGMELDLDGFRKRMKLTLFNGLGQIISFTLLGSIIAVLFVSINSTIGAIYFGLCLTFSSTLLVVKLLKDRKEVETFHGQTLIGILVMQDIVAVFALVFLNSLNGEQSILISVLMIIGKMILIGLLMYLFSKFFIARIFRKFAQTPELLFIGSLGYVFGIAALCESIQFSPEIGAFLSGVTLANLPYKIEIEDKVEPIKNLGVILFFVTLGYNLEFSMDVLAFIPLIIFLTIIVLVGTPLVMLILGYLKKLKSRPVLFMGLMLNQVSEFSLILATLCLSAGIFDRSVFSIITFTSILSFLLSSMGHSALDSFYKIFKGRLTFLERHSIRLEDQEEIKQLKLKDHIVLLEYNSMTDMIADKFAEHDTPVIILDFDPDKIEYIEKNESKYHHAIYADPLDPDVWEEIKLKDAALIVSGIEENHKSELALINYLKSNNSNAITIIHSNNYDDALEMYEADATYVILPDHTASERLVDLIEEFNFDFNKFKNIRINHKESIKKAKIKYMSR